KGVAVSCPATTLPAGQSMICTGSGLATAGQYENTGCVAATSPTAASLNSYDPDHYYGETPKVTIVKKTNGTDNNVAPGPIVAVGSTVAWTYEVSNTGNVILPSPTLFRSKGVAVSCPATTLPAGQSMICTGSGLATAGQYENTGCV